jgi:hypothetical protein
VFRDNTSVSETMPDNGALAWTEGVPVVDGPGYEMLLVSVSEKIDGVSSLRIDSGSGDEVGNDMLDVAEETIDVGDDGRSKLAGM